MKNPGKLGKLPVKPDDPTMPFGGKLRLPLAALATLPAPPLAFNAGAGDYPMYGNDAYGDCVEAGIAHQVGQYTKYASKEALFSDGDVLGAYSAITGFNPNDPSTDQGTVVQDALTWWRKSGLGGHRIAMFASLPLTNVVAIKQAICLFGGIGVGFNVPNSAMKQFNRGDPWSVTKGDNKIIGGHYVLVTGYDDTYLYTKTWGAQQAMTWEFAGQYVDEAWVVITPEMIGPDGFDAFASSMGHPDLYQMGQDFATLTKNNNPIPPPPPPPSSDPDARLAAAIHAWLLAPKHYATMEREAKVWLAAKNL